MGFKELKEELESAACMMDWGRVQRPVGESSKRRQPGSVLFGPLLVTPQPRHIEKVGLVGLVGLRVMGWRLPGSSVFP